MRSILSQVYKKLANVFVSPADLHSANIEFAKDRPLTLFAEWHKAASKASPPNAHSNSPKITICAVTLNSAKWLDAFWESVCALNYPREQISIHFVDHGSKDTTLAKLNSFVSQRDLRFLSLKIDKRPNEGYGAGNDYAIRQALDEFVLVTNVDVEFFADSLKIIVDVAARDALSVASWEFRQCPYEHPKYYDPVTHLSGWASHACVLLRKSAYLKVGGYDKNIFMYGEDVELSYRLRNNGWQLRYVPKAVIQHNVNLEDLSTRPHQLSGSIAANILLRRRYGTRLDRITGKFLMLFSRVREKEQTRKQAFKEAVKIYKENRLNFRPIRRAQSGIKFQFNNFDYSLRRTGATLPHNPGNDRQNFACPKVRILMPFQAPLTQTFKDTLTSVLNQTYENIEAVIIREPNGEHANFFKMLENVYGQKIRFAKPAHPFSRFDIYDFKYLCWLDSGNILFSDHIELLVTSLEEQKNVVAAQSYAWTKGGESVPSRALVLRKDYFNTDEPFADMSKVKQIIVELASGNSEQFLFLAKTTSIIQTTT